MSERLPYEEQLQQQWTDLPLPDENAAWEDMKRRLEEDDDDGGIAWWRRGCALWGLLLMVLLVTGWWLLKPEQWFTHKKTQKSSVSSKHHNDTANTSNDRNIAMPPSADDDVEQRQDEDVAGQTQQRKKDSLLKPEAIIDDIAGISRKTETASGPTASERTGSAEKTKNLVETRVVSPKKKKAKEIFEKGVLVSTQKPVPIKKNADKDQPATIADPVIENKPVDSVVKDSELVNQDKKMTTVDSVVTTTPADSILKKSTTADSIQTKTKPKSKQDNTFFLSAGIALQQLVPVGGQKATPYNSLGRKGTLLDYIPSVYVRLNRTDKWFIQSEFKYGAPQHTKEFAYKQQSVRDTVGSNTFTTTTSYNLKKTYYHQLPLTFNYYVMPGWSIGGGVVWNRFSSAISEKEIAKRNNQTQVDSFISKGIIKSDKDSAYASGFSKTYFQAVFETQYQWKRFSLGARYAFGLQPYIKFTLPGGTQQQEKNSSLQVFLRYQLWRSPSHSH